jgi:hypothetical protein
MAGAGRADAQVFLAARPNPEFTIGPLFVRATVTPALGPVPVDVLFSVVVPPHRTAGEIEQDLFLLWPGAIKGTGGLGGADRALAQYVEQRGFTVIDEGRLSYFAQNLYRMDSETPSETVPGGAPFVTFIRQGGALGLTSPATYVRIPWNPKLPNAAVLMGLRLTIDDIVKPKKASWLENAVWGPRHLIALSFNDVRPRGLFPLYLEQRNRLVRLADQPSQLLLHFADADHLKIDEVFPQSSTRQLHESLESTQVVSLFLDTSEGVTPQVLSVQFGYFTDWQAWTPVLIPMLFFILGNIAGPLVATVLRTAMRNMKARVQIGRRAQERPERETGVVLDRATLAHIVPGETTYEEVLRLGGREVEEREQFGAAGRRTLIYRGRRTVPRRKRTFGWLATVGHWDVEDHEVEIELDGDRVSDVQARVRRSRLTDPQGAG